jgi:hypothetical protein
MKKAIPVMVLILVCMGSMVFGQNVSIPESSFSATTPRFFSLDVGIGAGGTIGEGFLSEIKGVTVIGFKVAVVDDLEIGIDMLSSFATGGSPAFVGLRLGYYFTAAFGVAIGLGQAADLNNPIATSPGISLGLFYRIFADRSTSGIATAFKIRLDYFAATEYVTKGVLLFCPVFTLGL